MNLLELSVFTQFFGCGDHVDEGFGSEHGQRQRLADGVTEHQSLQRLGTGDRLAVCTDQEIAGSQAGLRGRSCRDDLLNAHSGLLIESSGHRRREWGGVPAKPR